MTMERKNKPMKLIKLMICLGIFSTTPTFAQFNKIFNSIKSESTLSSADITKGLKEALRVGTDSATSILSATDGYYKDEMVKILFPKEADAIIENASKVPGGKDMIDDVILGINRAAEDAAKDAAPIFIDAITQMSITDAANILKGDDDAATNYFKTQTYDALFALYQPKIKASLDKKLLADYSTQDTWDTLTKNYNKLANSFLGKAADLETVKTELDKYLTDKALDGLFLKISEQEAKIRTDPAARVNDILQKVFK